VDFVHDAVERLVSQTLADSRQVLYGYDAHGNIVSILPGRSPHTYSYNAVDKLVQYLPPALGTGTTDTLFDYDKDRQLTHATQPDGSVLNFLYDSAGVSRRESPVGQFSYAYDTTGNFSTITNANGDTLSFGHEKGDSYPKHGRHCNRQHNKNV